jgi:hypothetical protein
MKDVGSGLYQPSSCAFYTLLYVIIAEEDLHAFLHVLLDVDHHPYVCRGCYALVTLNKL